MLDDLRDEANNAPFFEEEPESQPVVRPPAPRFLGMTPVQRFIIAFLMLLMVVILGSFCALVTGAVVI